MYYFQFGIELAKDDKLINKFVVLWVDTTATHVRCRAKQ